MRSSTRSIPALLLTTLLAACDVTSAGTAPENTDAPPAASPGIVVLPLEVVVDEGNTSQLRVFERLPDGGAGRELPIGTPLTWRSDDVNVASIAGGLVQASLLGTTRITVTTRDGQSAASAVRVTREPARLEVLGGQDQRARVMTALDTPVFVKVTSKLGRPVQGSNVGFIAVAGGGRTSESDVSTDAEGFARTSWTLGPIAGEQVLEIRGGTAPELIGRVGAVAAPGPAAIVSVQPEYITLWAGTSMRLELMAMDQYGNRIQNVPVLWEVADPTVAQVSSSGELTGLRLGVTEVFGTLDQSALGPDPGIDGPALAANSNGKGKGTVVVGGPESFSISIGGNNQTGEVGTRLGNPLRLKVVDAAGRAVSHLAVSWVVTSGGGSLSAAQTQTTGVGQTDVWWTLGGVAGSQTVEARISGRDPIKFTATALAGPIVNIEVKPSAAQVKTGETFQYQAIATDRFGNVKLGSFTWTVIDPTVATVNSTGLVKGAKVNRTQVRATFGAVTGVSEVEVTDAATTTNAPPAASFTSSCVSLTCDFADTSTDSDGQVTSRSWSLGDGGTSTSATVHRTFAIAGTYTVSLRVTDDKGASSSTSKQVTVTSATSPSNALPVASFTVQCNQLACAFTDASTDSDGQIASRAWSFGNGSSSTATNPSHTYAAAGTYNVTLTVTDDKGASANKSQSVTVTSTTTQPPPTGTWNRVVSDTIVQGNLVIPAGEKWLIGSNVQVAGNVLVKDATLAMRPGSSLKFLGANPAEYVGGGMFYGPEFARDIGLWVWGSGQLDISCTPKTGWNRTGVDPSWLPGDEYWIAPTGVSDFAPRRWSPGQAIPRVDSRLPAAEVMNVTRDCKIEGPGHIHVNSSRPSRVEYVRLQSLGISQGSREDPALTGRYALHFHMSGDGTRGTVVRGVAAVDSRGRVYVPHTSHGVTMIDLVSVNSYADALWWDPGHVTNDFLADRLFVLGVNMPSEVSGKTSMHDGIVLAFGDNMEVRNSAVAGVRGSDQSNGFDWPEMPILGTVEPNAVWRFSLGNVAHNNAGAAIRFWNNNAHAHKVENFSSYHNEAAGIENGAYVNPNRYKNVLSYKDGFGGWYGSLQRSSVIWNSNSNLNPFGEPAAIENSTLIAAEGPAFSVGHRQLIGQAVMRFVDVTLVPAAGHPKVMVTSGETPWKAYFIRSGMTPDDIVFESLSGGNEGTVILIDHEDGRKWEVRVQNGQKVVTNR